VLNWPQILVRLLQHLYQVLKSWRCSRTQQTWMPQRMPL